MFHMILQFFPSPEQLHLTPESCVLHCPTMVPQSAPTYISAEPGCKFPNPSHLGANFFMLRSHRCATSQQKAGAHGANVPHAGEPFHDLYAFAARLSQSCPGRLRQLVNVRVESQSHGLVPHFVQTSISSSQ